MTHRFIKTSGTTVAALAALTVVSAASATPTLNINTSRYVGWDVWSSAVQEQLSGPGTPPNGSWYTDYTGPGGPGIASPLLSVATDCVVFGCFTMPQVTITGGGLKGYIRFQFQDFDEADWNTATYTGLWVRLQFQYTPTSSLVPQTLTTTQQNNIMNAVNGQALSTGVVAVNAENASAETDSFAELLTPSLANANNIFFNFAPNPATVVTDPSTGLSQEFVFAWNFTNVGSIAGNSTWEITGAGAVPAPGAIALLGVSGLIGASRRRRA